jgi:hypothetical protein
MGGAGGGGRVLELGIGTGCIALPLARRGVAVHGITSLGPYHIATVRAYETSWRDGHCHDRRDCANDCRPTAAD